MSRIEDFGQTQDVAVTVLVDNRADLILRSTETVKRFVKKPLLAEHGFAALIDLKDAGVRILWDAGMTTIALMENMARMEVDPSAIDVIALSHGHGDHTGAMTQVIKAASKPVDREWEPDAPVDEILAWVEGQRVPLIAHPAAFRERWHIGEDGKKYGPGAPPPRAEWEAAGAEVKLSEGPSQLGPGCWTTGTVPRLSFEKAGISGRRFYRDGKRFERDRLEDDQAIAIHVADKGLVVVAGCAHSGIVNTVNYAREISGVDKVWAVLGGFHLAPANDEEIERTIDEIERLQPAMVVPTHCTGFRAISRFAARMPEAFVLGAVGTTYLF
jgi:7,8-dihydropterin-6-yl-methyl-4-(beta-D-ribofuranosyl)aminobenzene 5'-phosphate synthase